MSELRRLAQPLFDDLPLERTPLDQLRRRARRRVHRVWFSAVAVVSAMSVAVALVVMRTDRGVAPTVAAGSPGASALSVSTLQVGSATDVAHGSGSVWVPGLDVVRRVDPVANAVSATIPVPGSSDYRSVAFGYGSVWVTDTGTGMLTRIDPASNRVVASIRLGGAPTRIVAAGGQIWVARSHPTAGGGDIVPVDPRTNRLGAPIVVRASEPSPFALAAHGDIIYASWDGRLIGIDTRTRTIMTASVNVDPTMSDVIVADNNVLAVTSAGRIVELDRIDLRVVQTGSFINKAQYIANGAGNVWVLSQPSSTAPDQLWRLDPHTLKTIGNPIHVGETSVAITVENDSVWVANYTSGTLTRIDTQAHNTRPELCPGPIPLDRHGADALPSASNITTNQARADDELRSNADELRKQFSHVVALTVGLGYGRAWTRDAGGRVIVEAVHDYAIIVHVRSRADCPSGATVPVVGTTKGNVPILVAVDSTAPGTIARHTIDGKTFGPMPNFGSGHAVTAADWAQIPDYVSVTSRDSEGIAGYVKKTDMLPLVNGQPMMNANIWSVYADGGSPLVGHFYPGKGFVSLAENPDSIPGRTSTTIVTAG